jgi:hypothetical protein
MTRNIVLTVVLSVFILLIQCIKYMNSVGSVKIIDDGKLSIWTIKESFQASEKVEFIISNFEDRTAYFNFRLDYLMFTFERKIATVWKGPYDPPVCPFIFNYSASSLKKQYNSFIEK